MRILSAVCVILLFSALALGQVPARGYAGYPAYGPYVPLVTTPQVSLETYSPSPVGATNASYGLAAGARNSTFSAIPGNTGSTYTEPVWYSGGGAPLVSAPQVSLFPRPLRGGALMRRPEGRMETGEREHAEAGARAWTYYAAPEETSNAVEAASAAKSGKKAARTYTNQDVEQQNQNNGLVKYDSKTEKLQ
jgi:hypothetical protein